MGPRPGQGPSVPATPRRCLGCDCGEPIPERIAKGDEAFRIGEYNLAVEIYRLLLPRIPEPDRELCLRLGNALARAGRILEALGAFRAAELHRALELEELEHLTLGLGHLVREDEWDMPALRPHRDLEVLSRGKPPTSTLTWDFASFRDLLSCSRCRRLLHNPVTLSFGLTVCEGCLGPGAAETPALRVNVLIDNLLRRCFPGQDRVRCLEGEVRELLGQEQLEPALRCCQQALELAPDENSLLLLRAELHLTMKNYVQALQDANRICYKDPFFIQGHHVKAQALSALGRTKEMLKELLYCLALNPEYDTVKTDAQKVIYEMFFSDSGNGSENLTSAESNTGSALQSPSCTSMQSSPEEGCKAGVSEDTAVLPANNTSKRIYMLQNLSSSVLNFLMGQHMKEDERTLNTILSIKPRTILKKKFPRYSKNVPDKKTSVKNPKNDGNTLPGRKMGEETGENPEFSVDVTDFECSLCMRLLFETVTTPCGHSFCQKCLERFLDHNTHCPRCKETLYELVTSGDFTKTALTEELILRYFPDELSAREDIDDEEREKFSHVKRRVPIFISTMAFPMVPCPLRVSDPRYGRMLKRSMQEGIKQFGMCPPTENEGIAEFGCMLEIKNIKGLPDRTSIINTVGVRRFRVMRRHYRDGYNSTANIEYLRDVTVEGAEYEELIALHDKVYQESVAWFAALQYNKKKQIENDFGLMPHKESEPQRKPSGPAWSWWILAVLPIEPKTQLAILGMTSLKERLLAIQHVLVTEKMNSQEEDTNTN